MKMKLKAAVLVTILAVTAVPAAASVDNAYLEDIDSSYNPGDKIHLTAVAQGEDIQSLRIERSDDNGFSWTTLEQIDCLGQSDCDTSTTDSPDSEGEVTYRMKAVSDSDTEEDIKTTIVQEEENRIDEADLKTSEDNLYVGETVDLDADASGKNIESLRIEKSDDNGFSWTTLKEIDCLEQNSCDTSTDYNQNGEGDVVFRAKAVSQGDSGTEERTVYFEERNNDEDDDQGGNDDGDKDGSEESDSRVDSVDVDISESRAEFGESLRVEADADGNKLGQLRIEKSTDEFEWTTLKSIDCLEQDSCDTSTRHTHSSGAEKVYYRARIVTENEAENDQKSVDYYRDYNAAPDVDLRQPYDGENGVSRNPVYRFKITDEDDSEMEDTTLYLEEKDFSGDEPWNVPDYKYNIHADVGDVDSYSSTTTWLDPDQEYVWGIKADDGDTEVRSEVYSFTTQGRDDDGDDDDDDEDGSLEVTVRDGDYDRLENANVRIKNGDYRTGSTDYRGEAEFANLHPDWYDVRVRCDGETETDSIYVSEDEEETLTVRMDQDSEDDYCNDDDGDDDDGEEGERPDASFTISDTNPEIGESVKFDASGSDGDIMEYRWAFPDGTSKYGTSVYKSFDSAGEKEIQLRVTEYDYDQDRTSRTITVQRRDDDDDEDEGEDPTARLDIDPSDAEIGEEIEFDATDSYDDGEIEEYEFDLDGDGDWDVENDDGEVERAFFDEFDGEARVRVTDDDGNRDVTDEDYEVRSRSRVSISTIDIPERVCDGESFEATFEVENLGDRERFIVLEARGFGDTRSRTIELDEDETREVSMTLTAGEAGSRAVRVSAQNSNTVRNTVEVLECDDPEADVSGISVSVMPDRAKAGESVQVSGYVENTRGREKVRILMNGRLIADTQTQPDGYYQVYAYPEEIGGNSIVASSGGETARTRIQVLPTVSVSTVETPENIFQGEIFEICGRVESQVSPLVVLMRNGERIDSKYGEGEVCFDTVSNTAGDTEYSIQAFARGESGSHSREVEVLETKPETSSFPGQIASVESGDGIVKATVYNNHDEQRRYDLELSGLPSTWVSTSEKQVILQPGEEREVFFYLTPREEGERTADVRIESQGSTIYDQSVDVWTGGTKENQARSITWRLRNAFSWW